MMNDLFSSGKIYLILDILFLRSSSSGGKEHTFWRSLCRPSGIFCTHRLFWTIQSLRRECTTHSENACTLTLVRLNTCSCQIDHPFWWLNTHFRYCFAVIILILSYINAVLVHIPLSSKCPWLINGLNINLIRGMDDSILDGVCQRRSSS